MLAAALLLLAAAQPSGGCAIMVTAKADSSFAEAGYEAGPQRLARLAETTRERFAAAARKLCAVGTLRPADLARFRTLIVQNGEGASDPVIFREPAMGRGVFIFQYAFQNGNPPPAASFEEALRCWKKPERAGCFED
ncbi:MAG: hypothetical protein ACJ8ER_14250 [Allosphingosinicella sp.]